MHNMWNILDMWWFVAWTIQITVFWFGAKTVVTKNLNYSSFRATTVAPQISHFNSQAMATGNLSVEDAFFTNMMLLGFDPVANEQKHNIQFNGEMFQMPNVKGMEVVFHFLFLKIFPDKAKEVRK